MQYIVTAKAGRWNERGRVVADGETLSFEQPWQFGTPSIVRVDDGMQFGHRTGGFDFAVEGLAEPTSGNAFVIAAHMMHDIERFKPYAAGVADVVKSFGGRFLARAGKIMPIGGGFVPDRAVLIEFPSADDVVKFYFSDAYAPLLKIRLATTEPRFVLIARSGKLSDDARRAVAARMSAS